MALKADVVRFRDERNTHRTFYIALSVCACVCVSVCMCDVVECYNELARFRAAPIRCLTMPNDVLQPALQVQLSSDRMECRRKHMREKTGKQRIDAL